MEQNKYSTPKNMSRSALPILYTNFLKTNWNDLFAIIFILYIGVDDLTITEKILYPLAIILIYLIEVGIRVYLHYHFFKFHVTDGSLIVQKGIINKQTLNIPTYKIHSLRTKSGFFYRLFDMKGISVDTLADKEKEVELILDDTDWYQLLEMFKDVKSPAADDTKIDDINNEEKKNGTTVVFPNMSLIKGALCQNHLKGTIIMAVVLFNIILQLDEKIISTAAEYAVEQTEKFSFTATSIIISLITLYIISLILWLGKVMLRYYNTNLDMSNEKLYFESGLITRRSVRFSHDKLSTMKIKVNFLEHLMHCSTVSMIQAFNVTDSKEKQDVLVYGCTFADKFLKWWFGNDYDTREEIMEIHSGTGVFWYSIKYKLISIIVAATILFHFDQFVYIVMLGVLLFFFIIEGILKAHHSRIVLKDDHIEVHEGGFASVTYYLKYTDVENIAQRSTPLTPYSHRIHLTFSTNGNYMTVRSLKEKEAKEAFEIILAKMYHSSGR